MINPILSQWSNIPPNAFALTASVTVSNPFAVQAGSSGSFTLNAPATGTFSGNVALNYSAPTGVSVTFQANPVASPGSTTFMVAASASAAVGNGTITITGMGGGITSVVSVPFMVTAAGGGTTTYSAPATFALSGSQTLNVTGPIMGPVATFVVTATGFNGFSAGQLIGLSTDSNVKTASLSYSPLASVYAGQSVTVGLTPLGQGTPVAGGLQYCGVIDATSTGYSNSSVTLCAVINGATQSTSVAFPQPSTGYAVPVRGSIMVQAAVSQFGSSTPVSFTQSVKCPGVSNCTAGASLVSSSNGNLTIQFNAGNVPGGLSYTQQFVINNEEIDVPVYCDPGGGVVAPTIIPATSYSSGSNVVTLATDNDGSTNSANYTMSCGTYSPCGFGSMGTCVAQGAGSHVTLFQRAYGAAGATSFGFSLSATADDQATAGFYQIACSYLGSAPIAGSLAVYDSAPVITALVPYTVTAGSAATISVDGMNFGNSPSVTVGGQAVSGTLTNYSGGSQVISGLNFAVPAGAAGTYLPVTVTRSGENGNGFMQNPQTNNGATATRNLPVAAQTLTVDSLRISQAPTANPVDGTAPTAASLASTNRGLTFATANSTCDTPTTQPAIGFICLLKGTATVTVTAVNPQPSSSANQLQWVLQPDQANFTIGSPLPALSGTSGTSVTFQPNLAGDFLLVVYMDTNGNGQFDPGEQLRTVQIAIVQATLEDGSTFEVQDFLSALTTGDTAGVNSQGRDYNAMQIIADYSLEGGGSDRSVGTRGVDLGDVGNLMNTNLSIAYPVPNPTPAAPGNVAGTGKELSGNCGTAANQIICPVPMIDTSRVIPTPPPSTPPSTGYQPTGGATAFRGDSSPLTDKTPLSTGGRLVELISDDSPMLGWAPLHPTTQNPWATTTGGVSFREFVAGYSTSFPLTYVSLNQAQWQINLVGTNAQPAWAATNPGTGVTGDAALQPVGSFAIQVRGRSYFVEATVGYNP